MMTNNNPRADAANVVMNNPKMQKMMEEALASPLGSTKRQKAKAVLQSLNKSRSNFTGQGGYQDGQGGAVEGILPWLTRTAPGAISSAVNTGAQALGNWWDTETQKARNWAQAGAVGTSAVAGLMEKAKSIPAASKKNLGAIVLGGNVENITGTPFAQTQGAQAMNQLQTQNPLKATILNGIPKKAATTPATTPATPTAGATAPAGTGTFAGMPLLAGTSGTPAQTYLDASTGRITNPFIAPKAIDTTKQTGTGTTPAIVPGATDTSAITSATSGVTGTGTTDTTGTGVTGTGTTDTTGTGATGVIADAVANQWGSAMTANIIMSDEKKWKEVFPNVPYPGGASLAGQQAKLFDTLKTEANLDAQQKALVAKQAQGATIEDDFNTYLHGKDTYLKEVDGMIDSNLNLMATTDMSDPFVRQQMGKYMDYLYLLKGRQLKSYGQYVDSSINQYNAEVTNMQNKYDADYKNFIEEYSKKSAVTAEDYAMYKDAIASMYDNLDGLAEKNLKLGILQNQLDQGGLDIIKTINEANGVGDSIKRDPMSQLESDAYNKALGLNPDGTELKDKDGNVIYDIKTNPDLYGLMAEMDIKNFRPEIFKLEFMKNVSRDVTNRVSKGNIKEATDFYAKTIASIDKAVQDGNADPAQAAIDKQSIAKAFQAGISSGMPSYLTNKTNTPLTPLKKALNDLTGKGWVTGWMTGGAYGATEADKAAWVNKYKGSVSENILSAIFDNYATAVGKGDYTPATWLQTMLAGGDETKLMNNISATVNAALDTSIFAQNEIL